VHRYDYACLAVFDSSKNRTLVAAWNSLDEDVKRAFWRDCVQSNPVGYQPPKQPAAVLNSVPDDLGRTAAMPEPLETLTAALTHRDRRRAESSCLLPRFQQSLKARIAAEGIKI